MMTELSKSIISTVVYYDVMDYPLTVFEIWKYLIREENSAQSADKEKQICLAEIFFAFENSDLKKNIEEFQGFFFVRGRKNLVFERLKHNKIAENKLKLIQSIVKILRFAPFVRMVAVTGRVAMKNAKKKSDLDLFIVIQAGKIFTGRILVTLITHFLGKRRYAQKIANRACLNFFVTDNSLEINLKDIYSSSEYAYIFPIFGREVFSRFQTENLWIKKFRPNFSPDFSDTPKMLSDTFLSLKIRKTLEFFLAPDFLEKKLKKWQMRRILNDPRTHKRGSGVMAGDQYLVFLPDPHGPKIFEKYQKKMAEISV